MTYESNLSAVEQAGLPELYAFESGTDHERVTSWGRNLSFLGYRFQAVDIHRSGFSIDADFGAVQVTITAPITDLMAAHIANQPVEPISVKIYRALADDLSDFVVIFAGQIRRISARNGVASAVATTKAAVLDVIIPRVVYQSYCNHMVFDSGCGLTQEDYQVETTVDVDGSQMESADFAAFPDGYFTGGHVQIRNDMRMITKHEGGTINLHVPFDSRVASGASVKVFPGCDGSPSTCKNKFNNFEDGFQGCPYIPSKNQVVWGVA